MDISQILSMFLISTLLLIQNVTSQKTLSDYQVAECPEGWLVEDGECYQSIPPCLHHYTYFQKKAFCQYVLAAQLAYKDGVLACVLEIRIPKRVLMNLLNPESVRALNKRVFGNPGGLSVV